MSDQWCRICGCRWWKRTP